MNQARLALRTSVVPGQTTLTQSNVYSRGQKCGGRHPVEAGAEARGMETPPETVELIWREFGQAEVDLFASHENTHCPLWSSLTYPAPLGLDAMVQSWPRQRLYAFPPITLLPGVLERVRRHGISLLLVAPYWPAQRTSVNYPVASVLEFLQSRFSDGLSPSMLKVYVAAIASLPHAYQGGHLRVTPTYYRGESVSDRGDPASAPPSPPQHLSVTLMAVTRLPTVRLSPVMKLP
ncbi:unnamed protein product [Leuciscus chuanchicus]